MNRGKHMIQHIPENKKISPNLLFFLIYSVQIGIGILGFQRIIAKEAGYDAWISIIISGISVHILLSIIFKMLEIANGDIYSVHQYVFGKYIGNVLSFIFIFYVSLFPVNVLRSYIDVVQSWMFPELKTFWFALAFLILCLYIIGGGFRTVTGISFFSIVLSSYVLFLFFPTFQYIDFKNLTPVFEHSLKDIIYGSYYFSFSILGFDTLLFFYPFLQKPKQSKKWGHLAVFCVTLTYLYLAINTFIYFPEAELEKQIWPTLTMWKIINLPFIERFEYIGIASWIIIILPNVCIGLWCGSRLAKRLFSIQQRTAAQILAFICLIAICLIQTRLQIDLFTNIVGKISFYVNYIYLPLLFVGTLIAKKVRKT